MFATLPTVLSQTGFAFSVQFVETTDDYILIRIRSAEMRPVGIHWVERPAVMNAGPFTLTDARGTTVQMIQSAGGSGPFAGTGDIAFPNEPSLDLRSPLTISTENAQMTFQIEVR